MADKAWKRRERNVCRRFGAERKPVSGRQHDKDGDDGEHPVLHVQNKHRKRHAVVKVWDQNHIQALKKDKVTLVTLTEHNRPGCWYVIKDTDLHAVYEQLRIAEHQRMAEHLQQIGVIEPLKETIS